ncbi:MAG: adenylosuccinate synthase, partial [Fimbriimonadaceae bacterium]
SLVQELEETRKLQSELSRLLVSPAAHIVLPYHRQFDQLEEEARGENKIGTTSRGIGPMYTDKVHRIGIRMGEFVDPDIFKKRLTEVLKVKNLMLEMHGVKPLAPGPIYEEYVRYAEKLAPHVQETETELAKAAEAGKKILFEGAQGTYLDLDHGTYPYVTSSHPIAAGACLGTGLGPRHLQNALGVVKAYCTRVGEGPFPTELTDELGDRLREQGHEYGTTTGRPRRVGWLDLQALHHSCRINSLSGLVITRLDTLAGFDTLNVAIGYKINGEIIDRMPTTLQEWEDAEPVYETLEGWHEDVSGCRSFEELPEATQRYVRFIEERVKVPSAILSVGPERAETIVIDQKLIW